MNTIVRLFKEADDIKKFAIGYLSYLADLLKRLNVESIASFVGELEEARHNSNTIFVVGNGGSAATASHMANDFGLDVFKKSGTKLPFRVMSLTDNASVMTAIGNDDGYDNLFICQLKIHYRKGDRLIVISASGNSPNVVNAAKWVKKQGGKVIGLLGFDGGQLKGICDVVVLVETPSGEYGPVEDIHMILDHLVGHYLLCRVLKEERKEFPVR